MSRSSLVLYLELGYLPAPYGMLENTFQLEAGSWLEVSTQGTLREGRFFEFPSFRESTLRGQEAYDAVDDVIARAVQRHTVSDVPVGTLLSGARDSPLVSAKMQASSISPIRAFTIGNQRDPLDESVAAAYYAENLGLDHIERWPHFFEQLMVLR